MRIEKAEFIKSATKPEEYPKDRLPEIAFYGRSNVGKSSLINMILNRNNLVKTGSKPGMTRLLNFFIINDSFTICDLPGFGYAELPEEIRNNFKSMIFTYFKNRKNLKAVFLLVDIRREPQEEELTIVHELSKLGIPTALVATKSDKLKTNEIKTNLLKIQEIFEIEQSDIFVTSSKNKNGRKDLLSLISSLIT
jgi:GTP-binding protein